LRDFPRFRNGVSFKEKKERERGELRKQCS